MKRISQLTAFLLAVILFAGAAAPGARAEGFITNVGSLAGGAFHSLFLQPDGTVVSAGYQDGGRCNVSGWYNIVKIAANTRSLGLRSDGTVVMAGRSNRDFDVSYWRNIIDIDVGEENAIGLRSDGTVVVTGPYISGQEEISYWRNVVQVSVDDHAFYGLRADGTVMTVSGNASTKTACTGWRNITAISAGTSHVLGLRSDGTVVAAGSNLHGQLEVSGWRNVVAVVAGNHHSIGLLADGRVVSTGQNDWGQCDVQGWYDIVDISAGMFHTLGLRRDGTILSTGSNGYGQCNISRYYGGSSYSFPVMPAPSYDSWDYGYGAWGSSGYYVNSVALTDLPYTSKYGKLWIRSSQPPQGYVHTEKDAPACWSDHYTLGYTGGPATDNRGNTYSYGFHLDGSTTSRYSISFDLDGRYQTFSGVCAFPGNPVNDSRAPYTSKYFQIYCDGRWVANSATISQNSAPAPFSISVRGVHTLTIVYPASPEPNEAATIFDARLTW